MKYVAYRSLEDLHIYEVRLTELAAMSGLFRIVSEIISLAEDKAMARSAADFRSCASMLYAPILAMQTSSREQVRDVCEIDVSTMTARNMKLSAVYGVRLLDSLHQKKIWGEMADLAFRSSDPNAFSKFIGECSDSEAFNEYVVGLCNRIGDSAETALLVQ